MNSGLPGRGTVQCTLTSCLENSEILHDVEYNAQYIATQGDNQVDHD